jgi:hypothetical protein
VVLKEVAMMQRVVDRRILPIVFGIVLLFGVASGCSDSSPTSAPVEPAEMVDNGSWYSRNAWPHDGNPYESESFVVYSDGASLEARQRLALVADEVLAEIVAEMGIDPDTMFRFPTDQDKIDLYANKYNIPDWGGGARGYWGGLIIWSFDHQAEDRPTDLDYIRTVLKHELVHVVESLLKGWDPNTGNPLWVDVWFSEGMAEALTGGTAGGAIRTLDQLNDLTAEYGHRSPIAYKSDSQVVAGSNAVFYYDYPMSGLAVEYLIDPAGLGKTPEDLTRILLDMADDVPFTNAFETHLGISVYDYGDRFFALMGDYLPQSDTSAPVVPISLVFVSVVAVSLIAGVLIWGRRYSHATAPGAMPTDQQPSSQVPRIGFTIEVSTVALLALGFFILVLFAIANEDEISNADKVVGFTADAGFLVASIAIMVWAIRRWVHQSRTAYLIPLLTVAAAAATIITIELIV